MCYVARPSTPLEVTITSLELAQSLARLAQAKKATDVAILDLQPLVDFCDYFVICNGRNGRQVRAIAQHATRTLKGVADVRCLSVEGMETSRWVLIDFGDVVLHVFDGELRGFYDLDGLWSDARRMPVPEPLPEPVAAEAQVGASA